LISTLRFLGWYGRTDLLEKGARRATRVLQATAGLAVAASIAAIGLILGLARVETDVIADGPLGLSLRVRGKSDPKGQGILEPISDEDVKRIKDGLAFQFKGVGPPPPCYPYRETTLMFAQGTKGIPVPHTGRTLWADRAAIGRVLLAGLLGGSIASASIPTDGDAIDVAIKSFKSATCWPNPAFTPQRHRGLVVSPTLLDRHHLNLSLGPPGIGEPAATVTIYSGNRPKRIDVLAITKAPLPLEHQFLIVEPYDEELHAGQSQQRLKRVGTGAVPDDWPSADHLPARVLELLRELRVEPSEAPRLRAGGVPRRWLLEHMGSIEQRPSRGIWEGYLAEIRTAMEAADVPAPGRRVSPAPAFPVVDTLGKAAPPKPYRTDYDYVAIYAQSVPDLRRAAGVCDDLRLRYSKEILEKLEDVDAKRRRALSLLGLVEVVLIGVVLWNMAAIQAMKAEAQAAEIGMLKAMGMRDATLVGVCMTQGFLIWLTGAVPGVLVGFACGVLLAFLGHGHDFVRAYRGFDCPSEVVLGVLGLSLLACLGAAWFANRRSIARAPSESLRAGR
jgi:hypothetical protein